MSNLLIPTSNNRYKITIFGACTREGVTATVWQNPEGGWVMDIPVPAVQEVLTKRFKTVARLYKYVNEMNARWGK